MLFFSFHPAHHLLQQCQVPYSSTASSTSWFSIQNTHALRKYLLPSHLSGTQRKSALFQVCPPPPPPPPKKKKKKKKKNSHPPKGDPSLSSATPLSLLFLIKYSVPPPRLFRLQNNSFLTLLSLQLLRGPLFPPKKKKQNKKTKKQNQKKKKQNPTTITPPKKNNNKKTKKKTKKQKKKTTNKQKTTKQKQTAPVYNKNDFSSYKVEIDLYLQQPLFHALPLFISLCLLPTFLCPLRR